MQTSVSTAPALENILHLIRQLPPPQIEQLQELIRVTLQDAPSDPRRPRDKRVAPIIPRADFSPALQWLAAHRAEYAGQWVALDGDRLIAAGAEAAAVFAAAAADGAPHPLITQIEELNPLPFAGF